MRSVIFVFLSGICLACTPGPGRSADHGFAATVHPLATDAALEAMKSGGNAVDGAIAAAAVLSVVDDHNSGIGGGLFMLVRKPDGSFVCLDGRETAPAAAHRDLFVKDGKAQGSWAVEGPLAPGVPGWLAALEEAARSMGRYPLARPFRAAAKIAQDGWPVENGFAARTRKWRESIRRFPATAELLLAPVTDGRRYNKDLAVTFQSIAEHGAGWFYRGPFAEKTGAWMAAHGGIMTAADFAAYQVKRREPLRTSYRGLEVIGFPPPSSGGVHIAQMLNMLETFDLKNTPADSADFIHTLTECMKPAFADRARWLGDPDFTPVPRGLIHPDYARRLAADIRQDRAAEVSSHGEPPEAARDVFGKHTTHFSVMDSEGWAVACTATVNYTWGSFVTIPGTGVILNNEMDDFSIQPGVPNVFGLLGGEANAVAPGKRPLSSMSPTIVQKDGVPLLVIGAAGGPTIISQVLQGVVRLTDYGQTPEQALAAARFHHQWRPDEVRIEEKIPESVREELRRRGHRLNVVPAIGVSQVVIRRADGSFAGAADPRADGTAAGF